MYLNRKTFFENSTTDEGDGRIFNGFPVGFCINEERLSVTNLSSENNLPTFRLNVPVVIRAKRWEND